MQHYLTVRQHFSAAHRIFNPSYSDARNAEVFGACSHPNYHGHNYEIEVTVRGEVHAETGMILDLKRLKAVVQEALIEPMDHRNLNLDVPFMKGVIPTAENIAAACFRILEKQLAQGSLYEVRLFETERNVAFCRAEE